MSLLLFLLQPEIERGQWEMMMMPALRHEASVRLLGGFVLSKLHTVSRKRVSRDGQWDQRSLFWSAVDFESIRLRLWTLAGPTVAQRKHGQAALAVCLSLRF